MARGSLQVVGDRPVILVTVRFADHVCDDWCDSAELRVAEGILRALSLIHI